MSISDDDVATMVCTIAQQQLGLTERPSEEAKLVDDLGADSLDLVEFVMALESEFCLFEIPNDEAERICTVGDAIACVRKYLAMKIGGGE